MNRKKLRSSGQPRAGQALKAQDDDYVFRFPLAGPGGCEGPYDDPLLELVRGQLMDLLEVLILTYHGKRVMVDGFRLLQDPDKQHEIHQRGGPGQRSGT